MVKLINNLSSIALRLFWWRWFWNFDEDDGQIFYVS